MAPDAQMHSKRITDGLSVDQETELQCLVHQLQLSDEAPSISTSIVLTPSSPTTNDEYGTSLDITNMIDEAIPCDEYNNEMLMVDMSQITDDVHPETVSPLDLFEITDDVQPETTSPLYLFGVLAIEMVEDVHLVLAPGLLTVVAHDDDVFEGVTSPVVVESEHVDPSLSFDVLLGFVSCFDDVLTLSSYMDMSLFEYLLVSYDITLSAPHSSTSHIFGIDNEILQHNSDDESSSAFDSSPNDQRDMSGLDPSIVQHHLPLLPHVRPVKYKLRQLHPRWSFQVKEEIQKQLNVGFLLVVEYPEWLANVIPVPKKDDHILMAPEYMEKTSFITKCGTYCYRVMLVDLKNARATYQRATTTFFHDMMHQDVKCQHAFERIKKHLLSPPILMSLTLGCPLLLYLSVSNIALGCMLAQLDDSGNEQVVYYLSKKMLDYETSYVMTERFCLTLAELDDGLPWYHDIYQFLRLGIYPEVSMTKDKRALRQLDTQFVIYHAFADRVMREVHAGVCGPHMGGHMLALWGIDIIGKISPKSSTGHEFILVTIDYFTSGWRLLHMRD
uniref:Reverse transcriptase/retrotransposon-derived protein RNase H-like domain-containing protein n=1 Tax=Vitis vinifera TaxID=29760 RepID=A5B3I8_VITVI|nr:hypothetical protein VITISV_040266 [Vitis vinifera]